MSIQFLPKILLLMVLPLTGVPVYAAEVPDVPSPPATKEVVNAEKTIKPNLVQPGSWVNIEMSGSQNELLVLASLHEMLQSMLREAKPRQRNLRIQLDSQVTEEPSLLGLTIEDMDVPEEDRITKIFFYNPDSKQKFQDGIRDYMETSLGLGFPVMPPVPELEKMIAKKPAIANVTVTLNDSQEATEKTSDAPKVAEAASEPEAEKTAQKAEKEEKISLTKP